MSARTFLPNVHCKVRVSARIVHICVYSRYDFVLYILYCVQLVILHVKLMWNSFWRIFLIIVLIFLVIVNYNYFPCKFKNKSVIWILVNKGGKMTMCMYLVCSQVYSRQLVSSASSIQFLTPSQTFDELRHLLVSHTLPPVATSQSEIIQYGIYIYTDIYTST
jgi:energy-coupling factor transporter transmembrane protein EcfT